jgi:hypothetical protein
MNFPRRMGRCFGRYVLVLFLLGHALAHVSGQVASANRNLPDISPKTDHDIAIPLGFAQKSLPDAMSDVIYESSVQAIGGSGLYELSVTGEVPPGLSIEMGSSTVAFVGIPTTSGAYAFQIIIRDAGGTSFTGDFSIHVYPRVLGAASLRPAVVTDTETITTTDAPSVFFPVVVIDNETIHTTDAVMGLDSVEVVDYEVITTTDSVTGLDAAEATVSENITTTDTITIAVLTVPKIYWTAPAPITYGTPLSATQLDATGSVDGTLTYTPPAGTVLPAGQQTLSVTLTPNNTTQYAPATDTVTITVNPATQSITFTPPASPVTYPVSPITLSATGGASGNPVVFSIVSGPGSVSGVNGSTLTVTGIGTVVVAANQAGNTNYTAAPQVTQSIVVNPPAIAILLSPTPGLSTTLGATNVVFQWSTISGASDYQLNLSAVAPGQSDLRNALHKDQRNLAFQQLRLLRERSASGCAHISHARPRHHTRRQQCHLPVDYGRTSRRLPAQPQRHRTGSKRAVRLQGHSHFRRRTHPADKWRNRLRIALFENQRCLAVECLPIYRKRHTHSGHAHLSHAGIDHDSRHK